MRTRHDPRRDTGCIVTWSNDDSTHVKHEPGPALEALELITKRIPAGGQVLAISTPGTILRDLKQNPRRYATSVRGKEARVDQYSVERNLLARIGRLDLLPREAS